MRIFLDWSGPFAQVEQIASALKSKDHKIVYWIGLPGGESKIPGAIFHNYFHAYDGLSALGFSIDQFPPPSRELIKRYSKLESLILTMMNKRFPALCVDERKHIYYNMLQYWQGIFKKYKPEAIIFNAIPHGVFNYILYQFARDNSVKTIMFENTWISDRLIMYNDWRQGSKAIQEQVKKNKGKNFSLKDLSRDLQEYYQEQTNGKKDTKPLYAQQNIKIHSGRKNAVKKRIKTVQELFQEGILLKRGAKYLLKCFKSNLKKDYLKLQSEFDPSKKFVYAPLHLQPECSSCPQGDTYWDQILMVETLSYALPKDWLIYVKEHPIQWVCKSRTNYSCNRYPGYYRRMAKLKNVRLMPIKTDTFVLTNKSQAVATATGTAAWEAVLRGKPALIFGYPEFCDCPCLFRVDSAETCQAAFEKIIKGFKVKKQDVVNFLVSFDRGAPRAFLSPILEKTSEVSAQESMRKIIGIILSEIEEQSKKL